MILARSNVRTASSGHWNKDAEEPTGVPRTSRNTMLRTRAVQRGVMRVCTAPCTRHTLRRFRGGRVWRRGLRVRRSLLP